MYPFDAQIRFYTPGASIKACIIIICTTVQIQIVIDHMASNNCSVSNVYSSATLSRHWGNIVYYDKHYVLW